MIVRILAVGKPRGPLADAIRAFEVRAGHYWRIETAELKGGGKGRKDSPDEVRRAESARLLARCPKEAHLVALTREGTALASRGLADFLQQHAVQATPELVFLLGGAYGLGEEVLARASSKVSLSAMTLPHELARLVLAEQLYRAGTILKNEPYHKGP